jgi:hypothetical protein
LTAAGRPQGPKPILANPVPEHQIGNLKLH